MIKAKPGCGLNFEKRFKTIAALAPPRLQKIKISVVAFPINCGEMLVKTSLKTEVTTILYQKPDSIAPISITQRLLAKPTINSPRANGIIEMVIKFLLKRPSKPSKQIPERIPISIIPLKIRLA